MSDLSTKNIKRKYTNWYIQGKIETPQGIQVYRLHYYHDNCITEETKRKLHTAPSSGKQPPKKKAKKDNNCNTSTSNAKKKPGAKQSTSTNTTTNTTRQLKPKLHKQLEKDLRQLRSCYATAQGNCEEYKIFSNKSLTELTTKLPTNNAELKECWGIKGKRIKQYGKSILKIINMYLDQQEQEQQGSCNGRRTVQTTIPRSPPSTSRRTTATVNNSASAASTSFAVASSSEATAVVTPAKVSATLKKEEDTTDDEEDIVIGPTISIEEIVRGSVREAEARGEVLEIL